MMFSFPTTGPLSREGLLDTLKRVRTELQPTPLTFSERLSERTGHQVYIKWDNKLRTGSFKERGAVAVLSSLAEDVARRGVIAASAGNHALALSYHAKRRGIPCTLVMPMSAPLVKVQSSRATGARVILEGKTFDEAYEHALQLSAAERLEFISPFDDERIISGQSTCGQEIADILPEADVVVVPVGGGGLATGVALALRSRAGIHAHVIGVQSEWAAIGRAGGHQHSAIPPTTIADGIAVKRAGAITAPLLTALMDQMLMVTEDQIATAVIRYLEDERTVIEGAGAAALAALLSGAIPGSGKKVVVLACGSNIDTNVLSRLIERHMGDQNRILHLSISVPDQPGSLATLTRLFADARANVLEVRHSRAFSEVPGNVEIDFMMEVSDQAHREDIEEQLEELGLPYVVRSAT